MTTFDTLEKSTASGRPYELYLFEGTGILFALTSGVDPVTYNGNTYAPATISRTEIDQSAETDSGKINVYVPRDHPVALLFRDYLPTSPVALTVFGSHVGASDTIVTFSGEIASAHFTDEGDWELICNSDQAKMTNRIPRIIYQSACPHIFGDEQCGIDLATVTYVGEVTAISADGTVITVPDFASLPHPLKAGFFKRGNDVRMIIDEGGSGSSRHVTLINPIADLEVGETVEGVAGCQQTFAACVGYDNIANFLGFDLIPISNPFDGSIQ